MGDEILIWDERGTADCPTSGYEGEHGEIGVIKDKLGIGDSSRSNPSGEGEQSDAE